MISKYKGKLRCTKLGIYVNDTVLKGDSFFYSAAIRLYELRKKYKKLNLFKIEEEEEKIKKSKIDEKQIDIKMLRIILAEDLTLTETDNLLLTLIVKEIKMNRKFEDKAKYGEMSWFTIMKHWNSGEYKFIKGYHLSKEPLYQYSMNKFADHNNLPSKLKVAIMKNLLTLSLFETRHPPIEGDEFVIDMLAKRMVNIKFVIFSDKNKNSCFLKGYEMGFPKDRNEFYITIFYEEKRGQFFPASLQDNETPDVAFGSYGKNNKESMETMLRLAPIYNKYYINLFAEKYRKLLVPGKHTSILLRIQKNENYVIEYDKMYKLELEEKKKEKNRRKNKRNKRSS